MSSTNITVGDALLISLVGFLIVFAALIILMFTIRLISAVARALEKKETPAAVPAAAASAPVVTSAKPVVPVGMVPAKGSLGEIKLFDTDEKTAAMLMAIVADELKAPLNELRFVSIRTK